MKNPTYAQFLNEVEKIISELSGEELRKKIVVLAENQAIGERNRFLQLIAKDPLLHHVPSKKIAVNLMPKDHLARIRKFYERMRDGEFFDEEADWRAVDREDHYWRQDQEDREADDHHKALVLEALEMLEDSKQFFRRGDKTTALEAYHILFDILENPEYYESEAECFIYGFSFREVIEKEIYKEYKAIYLRCLYEKRVEESDFKSLCEVLVKNRKDVLLSDILDIDRTPLPRLKEVTQDLICRLEVNASSDKLLEDVLFVKGGSEEVKKFAYAHGDRHSAIFLSFYKHAKESGASESELGGILEDGIRMIPQRLRIRSLLGLELVRMAKKNQQRERLLLGYSAAFYSDPTLSHLILFIDFIFLENQEAQQQSLLQYLAREKVDLLSSSSCPDPEHLPDSMNSSEIARIESRTAILGRYILEGIESFLPLVSSGDQDFMGYSGQHESNAVIMSLILKSLSQSHEAGAIDALVNHYCIRTAMEQYSLLTKWIAHRANLLPEPRTYLLPSLAVIEDLSVKRVRYILTHKLRGGYESACLLLAACAEAKEIVNQNGNELIRQMDLEFRRFSAFRKTLKELTKRSRYLQTVGAV